MTKTVRFARFISLLLLVLGGACTNSTQAIDDGANLVFPSTDFTGRSFTAEVPATGRTTIYATEVDANFATMRHHLWGMCAQRVAPRFRTAVNTIADPDGTQIGLISASLELNNYVAEDGIKCGRNALERASVLLCAGYEALALSEATDPKNFVVYESPQSAHAGILIDRIERPGVSSALPAPWVKADDYDVLVPPQDTHGTGTLAMVAHWYFRDAALVAAGILDHARCPQNENALDADLVPGAAPDGRIGTHPDQRTSLAQLAGLIAGEALEALDESYGVMRAAILAEAQARVGGEGAPEEAARLSWSAPFDSRLELVNHLVGVKASLYEPMDMVLPRPMSFVLDGGVGTAEFAENNALSVVSKEELANVLKGEFPEVTADATGANVQRVLDLIRSLGVDTRASDCLSLRHYYYSLGLTSQGLNAVFACGLWNGRMPKAEVARRLRIALLAEFPETFAEACASSDQTDEGFLRAIGVDPDALEPAAYRLNQEALALGIPRDVDPARTKCPPPGSAFCGSAVSGTACVYDIRISGGEQRVPLDPSFFVALASNRSRPIPSFYLRENQVNGINITPPGNWHVDYLIGTGTEPPRWYPGHNGTRISNYETDTFGADELIRGYAGQGLFETRDAVATIIKSAIKLRTDLDANATTGAEDARPTLRSVYLQHRQAVPMRLQVCTGSGSGIPSVAYAELWGTPEDFSPSEYQWRVAYGEKHLGCLLGTASWASGSTECPDPISSSQAPIVSSRTTTSGDLEASQVWAWRPANLLATSYSAPSGRIYLLRRKVDGPVGAAPEVVTGFTAEWEDWRVDSGPDGGLASANPVAALPFQFEGTDESSETTIRLNRCNWYPVGPEVNAAVAEVLTPGTRDAALPQKLCGDVDQDVTLPLEDSLSANQLSGDTIESSFRHFLQLARQAADEADLLGETLIKNGLEMDVRAELARDALEESCGGRVNVGDLSQVDLSGIAAGDALIDYLPSAGRDLDPLRRCLGQGGEDIVAAIASERLCLYRHKETGRLCQTSPGMPECPLVGLDEDQCLIEEFDLSASEYEAISAPPLRLSALTFPTKGGDKSDCALVADLREARDAHANEPNASTRQRVVDLATQVGSQKWYSWNGVREIAARLSLGVTIPDSEHPEYKFVELKRDGTPFIRTGDFVNGPSQCGPSDSDFPCGPLFADGEVHDCPTGSGPIAYCGFGAMDTNAQRVAAGERIQKAWREIKKLTLTDELDRNTWPAASSRHQPYTVDYAIDALDDSLDFPQIVAVTSFNDAYPVNLERVSDPSIETPPWMLSDLEFMAYFPQGIDGVVMRSVAPFQELERSVWNAKSPLLQGEKPYRCFFDALTFTHTCNYGLTDYFPCATPWDCTSGEWILPENRLDSFFIYQLGVPSAIGPYYASPAGQYGSYPFAVTRIADRSRHRYCVVTDGQTCIPPAGTVDELWSYGHLPLRSLPAVEDGVELEAWNDDPSRAAVVGTELARAFEGFNRLFGSVYESLGGGAGRGRPDTLPTQTEWYDALEILCLANHSDASLSVCDAETVPEIRTVEDLEFLEQKLGCMTRALRETATRLYVDGVPGDVAADIESQSVTAAFGRASGSFGSSIAEYRTVLEQVARALDAMESALRDGATTLQSVRSLVRQEDLMLQQNFLQREINGLNFLRQRQQQLTDCVVGLSQSVKFGPGFVELNPSGIAICANAFTQIAFAAQIRGLEDEISALGDEVNRERAGQLLRDGVQGYANALEAFGSASRTLVEAYGNVHKLNADIAGHRRDGERALAKMLFLDRDDTGREYNVNRVMRSRMNTDRIRYQRAKDNAIKMAWVARKAIEQRIGVDLSDIHTNMTLVPPPASWANTVCTMSGIDYNRIRSVDDDKIENYADGYIGDYVTLLENFVESYRFDYPFQDGEDVAVVSMRDEVFGIRTTCEVEGGNLLLWSVDSTQGSVWRSQTVGEYAVVAAASDGVGPFEASSKPGGASSRISLGCSVADESGFPDCSEVGASLSRLEQPLDGLEGGDYVVSWYEKLATTLVPGPNQTCADVNPAMGVVPRLSFEAFTAPSEPDVSAAPLGFLMNQEPRYVPVAADADLTDACSWRRVVAGFNNPYDQDIVVGWQITESVTATSLPSAVEWAAPQLEYAPENSSATASPWFPTDDDWSYPVGLCTDSDGKLFSTPLNWSYKCEQLCADGLGTACVAGNDAATLERCFHEASFNISLADIERGKLGQAGGFAVGNFNYRFNEVGINLVGTGLRDCSETDTPATCYSSAFIPYSIRHSPPYRIRNYEGEVVEGNLFPGNIEHAKGLMAERYITNPISSADRTLLNDYWRREFRGRPLEGNFRLRVWDSPGFDFSKLEDIQLILSYRYWTRAQ